MELALVLVLVLGVILLLAIILGAVAIFCIYLKLRQHERDIIEIRGDLERGKKLDSLPRRDLVTDSAIELNEELSSRDDHKPAPAPRPSRPARPRMTIKIHKAEANLYGCKPHMSQVMQVAQNFYKTTESVSTDVPAETVQVINKDTNRSMVASRVLTEDWKQGRATSMLINENNKALEEVLKENKGIFSHQTVGQSGGRLEISGVTLDIPEGALEKDVMITVGIIWDERYSPKVEKKQAVLSPTILCQPNGLRFKKAATLRFPHCARNLTQDWNVKILKREGSLTEDQEWTTISLDDYEERDFQEDWISLKLCHFTLYSCCGEARPGKNVAKVVNLCAFAPKLIKGSHSKPVFYCINHYKELEDTIQPVMKSVGKVLSDTPMPLFLHDDGNDVIVEVDHVSGGWSVVGTKTEVIPFEQAWHATSPHCTFVFSPARPYSEITCDFLAYQSGRDNRSIKLKIAEKQGLSLSPLSSPEDDPVEELINELVILLDPIRDVTSDWRNFAECAGCDLARINWLKHQDNPTRILLEKWILEEKRTFTELVEVMTSIERLDAAEEIRKRLSSLETAAATST